MVSIPNLFTPPSIQLGRDAVNQKQEQGRTDQQLFRNQLEIETTKKSTLTNMIEGLNDGLTLAKSVQQIQNTELSMRQAKVDLAKHERLNDLQIRQAEEDERFLEALKAATPQERLNVIENTDASIVQRNQNVALAETMGVITDPNAPPALRQAAKEQILPKIDPQRAINEQTAAAKTQSDRAFQLKKIGIQEQGRDRRAAMAGQKRTEVLSQEEKDERARKKALRTAADKSFESDLNDTMDIVKSENPTTARVMKSKLDQAREDYLNGRPIKVGDTTYKDLNRAQRAIVQESISGLDKDDIRDIPPGALPAVEINAPKSVEDVAKIKAQRRAKTVDTVHKQLGLPRDQVADSFTDKGLSTTQNLFDMYGVSFPNNFAEVDVKSAQLAYAISLKRTGSNDPEVIGENVSRILPLIKAQVMEILESKSNGRQ